MEMIHSSIVLKIPLESFMGAFLYAKLYTQRELSACCKAETMLAAGFAEVHRMIPSGPVQECLTLGLPVISPLYSEHMWPMIVTGSHFAPSPTSVSPGFQQN